MKTFTLAWTVSICVYALVHLADEPTAFGIEVLGAIALGGAIIVAESRGATLHRAILPVVLVPVAIGTVAYPLALDLHGATQPRETLGHAIIWPQLIVLLFTSRLLAEMARQSSSDAWGAAGAAAAGSALHRHSVWATAVLGGFFTLAFYGLLSRFAEETDHPIFEAFFGETPINAIVVFLFFVVISELIDLWLGVLRDRAILHGLGNEDTEGGLADRIADMPDEVQSSAAVRRILAQHAVSKQERDTAAAGVEIEAALSLASRRYVRNLVSSLPLIGFTGTVLGIMAALAEMPAVLDSVSGPGGLSTALTGTLGGLATAFQTTLLGLVGSLIASILLAGLERAEAATVAAGDLLASSGNAR